MKSKTLILLFAVVAFACSLFVVSAHGPNREGGQLSTPTPSRSPSPSPHPSPAAPMVSAQQPDDEDVRGAFLTSRPKNTTPNATRRRRPPRRSNNNPSNKTNSNTDKGSAANQNRDANKNSYAEKGLSQAIGLGYTLFMRDSNGGSVRVEPDHEFHKGDRVRIALEPNVDGYLYVFHAEGDGQPEMIYPDWRLDAGENWVEAHVPIEVPSSHWFVFDANPAIEHLFVVVTREPLGAVPAGGDLVKLCSSSKEKCPWRPASEIFLLVQEGSKAEVKIVTSKTFGQSQTDKEKTATTRGLGLDASAPEPAVIRMNAVPSSPMLVAVLDLIHK
jgi:hypothetical protein